jgi:hypothetical protein
MLSESRKLSVRSFPGASLLLLVFSGVTQASLITGADIVLLGQNVSHSGNGTLDLVLLEHS